jgi:tetratricopeptide (TPR) repeat protein
MRFDTVSGRHWRTSGLLVFLLGMLVAAGTGIVMLGWSWPRLASRVPPQGVVAYDRGDWQTAAAIARDQLRLAPSDVGSLRLLARASARLGRDDSARALFGRLGTAALQPEDLFLLGLVMNRLGKPELAVDSWELAATKDANHPEALNALATTYREQQQFAAALDHAVRLEKLPLWAAQADLQMAAVHAALGDHAAEATALRRALGRLEAPGATAVAKGGVLAPVEVRKRLARALLQLGRPLEVQDVLQNADDRDIEVAWLKSRVAIQTGEAERDPESADFDRAAEYRAAHLFEPEPAPYAGAASCAGCHRSINRPQQRSLHSRTFRRIEGLKDPVISLPAAAVADPGEPKALHTLTCQGDTLRYETTVDGRTFSAIVQYALGSGDRGLTLVGRDEQGQVRELRLSRYADAADTGSRSGSGSGWDVTTGQPAHPGSPEDCLGRPLSADSMFVCLSCHTTDARAARDKLGSTVADHGIGCERCHGPGGHHATAAELGLPDLAIAFGRGRGSGPEINRLCGRCHSPSPGTTASPEDPGSIKFQAATLPWSRCYKESGEALSCMTCHDPHRNANHSPAHYEAKCLSCHLGGSKASANPSDRVPTVCPVNKSADCLKCHMPVVRTWKLPHSPFTDHFIRIRRDVGMADVK